MMVWVYLETFHDSTLIKMTKEIFKIFKSLGLSIIVTANVKSTNYLDVNFDLKTDIHRKVGNQMMNLSTLINIPATPKTLCNKSHYQEVQELQIILQISLCLATLFPYIKTPSKMDLMMT